METLAVASCFGAAFELWVDRARGSVIVWMGFLGARANAWMGLVDCRLNFPQLEALDAHQGLQGNPHAKTTSPLPEEATPPKQKMPPMPVSSPQAPCLRSASVIWRVGVRVALLACE